jgi:prepilin-type processing-associated H-X9-DG protein
MGREGVYCVDYTRNPPTYDPRNCLIDGVVFARESQYRAMFTAASVSNVTPSPAYPLTTAMEDVIDGTSNTVALSETVQGVPPSGVNDLRGLIWWGAACFFNTNQAPNTMVADMGSIAYLSITGHTQHPLSPMSTSTSSGDGRYMRFSARSWHSGGVNAGLADGSIRFITNQINLDIWRAAGSTNGGEVVSLP